MQDNTVMEFKAQATNCMHT